MSVNDFQYRPPSLSYVEESKDESLRMLLRVFADMLGCINAKSLEKGGDVLLWEGSYGRRLILRLKDQIEYLRINERGVKTEGFLLEPSQFKLYWEWLFEPEDDKVLQALETIRK